jgi:type VI secretion system protein
VNVKVTVAPNVNQGNPIQVEMLLIYDEALLKQIIALQAKDWFDKRDEIRKNYPDGAGYDSWQWEWIPNQSVGVQQVPLRVSAIATVVFANYYAPGPHRIRVSPHENMTVTLLEKGFTVDTE